MICSKCGKECTKDAISVAKTPENSYGFIIVSTCCHAELINEVKGCGNCSHVSVARVCPELCQQRSCHYFSNWEYKNKEENKMEITKISREQAQKMADAFSRDNSGGIVMMWDNLGFIEKSAVEEAEENYNKFMENNQMNQDLNVIRKYVALLQRKA